MRVRDMSQPSSNEPATAVALWLVVLMLGLIGLSLVAVTGPMSALLGSGAGVVHGALHGTVAGLFMVTSTIGLFQAYRIFAGRVWNLAELQIGSVINAAMALLTILSGNWIYIPYRATGGPRSHFLQVAPEVHKVFFEFKEFAALFSFPLAVVAAYLLVRYGGELHERRGLGTVISALLVLVFFYFVVTFGLGAAITKLKPV